MSTQRRRNEPPAVRTLGDVAGLELRSGFRTAGGLLSSALAISCTADAGGLTMGIDAATTLDSGHRDAGLADAERPDASRPEEGPLLTKCELEADDRTFRTAFEVAQNATMVIEHRSQEGCVESVTQMRILVYSAAVSGVEGRAKLCNRCEVPMQLSGFGLAYWGVGEEQPLGASLEVFGLESETGARALACPLPLGIPEEPTGVLCHSFPDWPDTQCMGDDSIRVVEQRVTLAPDEVTEVSLDLDSSRSLNELFAPYVTGEPLVLSTECSGSRPLERRPGGFDLESRLRLVYSLPSPQPRRESPMPAGCAASGFALPDVCPYRVSDGTTFPRTLRSPWFHLDPRLGYEVP